MKFRKIFAALLITCLIAASGNGVYRASADDTVEELALGQAVENAIQNNGTLQTMDHVIEASQVNVRERQSAAEKIDQAFNLDLGKVKYFLPFDAKVKKEIAVLDKQDKQNSVAMAAFHAYIDALHAEEAIKVLTSGVNRTKEQVDLARLNFELGTVTKVDVLSSEVQWEKTKSELALMENNLRIKKMQLNQVMNRSLAMDFSISETEWDDQYLSGEEGKKAGLNHSIAIKKSEQELLSAEKLLEVVSKYFPENTYAYQSSLAAVESKRSQRDEIRSQVELAILSKQINIDSLREKHHVAEQQLEKVKITYNIMLEQYKAGLISYQDLANTDQLLKQTDLEELQSRLEYQRAIFEYKLMTEENII